MSHEYPFVQLSNLIWELRTCQAKLPHEIDSAIIKTLKRHRDGLGFYAFLSEIKVPGKRPIVRFFSTGPRNESTLQGALRHALTQLDRQPPSQNNGFNFLDLSESDPTETARLGKTRKLRALAVKTAHFDDEEQLLPLRMAILADTKSPAFTASSTYWVPLAAEIDGALHARDSMFLHFPPAYSEYLWRATCNESEPASQKDLEKRGGLLNKNVKLDTVTLSLDLRQSTFAMEKVISRDVFSRWMEGLIKVYRGLICDYHGVFDKFTGDGVLAHFLDPRDLPGGNTAGTQTQRGAQCAMDMVAVTGIFFDRLQPNLRVDSKLFGAGVGIAADYANWSMDGARNPTVVGHGVVDACRLCARAKAGKTLITVNAYHRLRSGPSTTDTRAEKVYFSGKNYPDEMQLMVWQLKGCGPNYTARYEQLRAMANEALKDIPELALQNTTHSSGPHEPV